MAGLVEGAATQFRYKFYSSGDMTTNAEEVLASAPGASGGRLLRRVSVNLNLRKNATRSQEINPSRMVRSSRHTSRRTEGAIDGELSPGAYFDFIEAAHRDTAAAMVVGGLTEADLGTATADNTTGTWTFSSGDPVAEGLRKGGIIVMDNLVATANEGVKFMILGFSGTSNRTVTVFPKPTTAAAEATWTLATPGKTSLVPQTGHVRRKLLVERYHPEVDRSRVYTEQRVTGYRLSVPAEGNATFGIDLMGRNRRTLSGGSAPYFTAPSDAATKEVVNSLNGVLMVGGTQIGTVTGITMNLAMAASAPAVLGQAFPPDVLLGTAAVTGQITALIDDTDAVSAAFEDELETEVLFLLTSGGPTADAIAVHLTRLKLNGGDEAIQGEGEQVITVPYEGLEYLGTGVGMSPTVVRITDTAAA